MINFTLLGQCKEIKTEVIYTITSWTVPSKMEVFLN